MENREEIIRVVTCYLSNPYQLAIGIPSEVRRRLRLEKGTKLLVKLDEKERIILEPLNLGTKRATNHGPH
ncbi:MAG: AbrB/MazE/SpoVT family DNA-binding domain-containing protein [Thermoproteota archaeon]